MVILAYINLKQIKNMDFTRTELLNMAKAYHGRAYTKKQFDQFSNERLLSMTHPTDSERKGKGWGPNGS